MHIWRICKTDNGSVQIVAIGEEYFRDFFSQCNSPVEESL